MTTTQLQPFLQEIFNNCLIYSMRYYNTCCLSNIQYHYKAFIPQQTKHRLSHNQTHARTQTDKYKAVSIRWHGILVYKYMASCFTTSHTSFQHQYKKNSMILLMSSSQSSFITENKVSWARSGRRQILQKHPPHGHRFFSLGLNSRVVGSRMSLQKLQSRLYFKSSMRDIGKSFQLAITTPRLDLIGYGTTTAQS